MACSGQASQCTKLAGRRTVLVMVRRWPVDGTSARPVLSADLDAASPAGSGLAGCSFSGLLRAGGRGRSRGGGDMEQRPAQTRGPLTAGSRSGLAVLDSCRGIFDQGLMMFWFVLVGGVPVSHCRCRARRPAARWLRFARVDALRVCGPVPRVCGRSRRSPRR